MQLGEKADLFVKPKPYGYGKEGKPPKIPKNSLVIFNIEIIHIEPYVSEEEYREKAFKWKEDGNQMFKKQEYEGAISAYQYALNALEKMKDKQLEEFKWKDEEDIRKLKISCWQNMSICANKIGNYKLTIKMCRQAIYMDNTLVKAWSLRGVANLRELNFDEATRDLKKAIELSPKDKNLRTEWENLNIAKKK